MLQELDLKRQEQREKRQCEGKREIVDFVQRMVVLWTRWFGWKEGKRLRSKEEGIGNTEF